MRTETSLKITYDRLLESQLPHQQQLDNLPTLDMRKSWKSLRIFLPVVGGGEYTFSSDLAERLETSPPLSLHV